MVEFLTKDKGYLVFFNSYFYSFHNNLVVTDFRNEDFLFNKVTKANLSNIYQRFPNLWDLPTTPKRNSTHQNRYDLVVDRKY